MKKLDLANLLRDERKMAELMQLDKDFYRQVGAYFAGLEADLSNIEDHYSVEAQIIEDELKGARKSIGKLIDLRLKKISRRVLKDASFASKESAALEITPEEELIYRQMISAVLQGREKILASITGSRTERPLTGRSDKAEEYAVVRLLNSVPTFIGVNGKRYILTKEDVVMIPAVHAKNLCDKGLAYDVKVKR